MRTIALTKGKIAFVDDADYMNLEPFKWFATQNRNEWYAARWSLIGKRNVYMHCDLLQTKFVDHINGDGLDNRRLNLREATIAQNSWNQRAKGRSRFKGVSQKLGAVSWKAAIYVEGRTLWLGSFPSEEEAARAYDRAAQEHFGEFARLNFPILEAR